MQVFEEQFRAPPAGHKGLPFWSWNGRLEKDELLRQIDIFEEMGFGGFFMHSRVGLQTEYLSEEWFRLINACADHAEEKGMTAWLYDEDRWPSGIAGGLVTQDPAYGMRCLKATRLEEGETPPEGSRVYCCLFDEDEVLLAYRPQEDCGPGFARNRRYAFTSTLTKTNDVYNGYTYADTMNMEATRRFLQTTHEKYLEKCGGRMGKSIPGIFTDEPHRGALMDVFGGEDILTVPWTGGLPQAYRDAFGADIFATLPEIFFKVPGRLCPAKWRFVEICQRLFLENFLRPINEWCEEHGLIFTGHLLHEDCLTAQTAVTGSLMRGYEHMGWPGIDVLGNDNRNYWIAKQLQSAARQLGQKKLLSELYGCSGWQMSLADYKRVGDWQALFGINVRCPHLAWYTMEDECKRDYPASISFQSGWWREYRLLEDYFTRVGMVMEKGEANCRLLVVSPLESVWCQVHTGWSNVLNPADAHIAELERRYAELFGHLMAAHIDFDYGDEDFIARMARVDAADKTLRLGRARYTAVLVSGADTLRQTTVDRLRAFAAAGGRVLFCGKRPGFVDAAPAAEGALDFGTDLPFAREALAAALADLAADISSPDVYAQTRVEDGRRWTMLLNMANHAVEGTMRVDGALTRYDCRTGETGALESAGGLLRFHLEAGQELVFCAETGAGVPKACAPAAGTDAGWQPMDSPVETRLDEDNVCVLDTATLTTPGGPTHGEVLALDRAIRDELGLPYRGGGMLQPWFREKHPQQTQGVRAEFTLEFTFDAEQLPAAGVRLAMEHPERFEIELNGRLLKAVPTGWWVDPCIQILPVDGSFLSIGENRLVLKGCYDGGWGFEAVYLLGGFGVRLEGDIPGQPSVPGNPGSDTIEGPRPVLTAPKSVLELGSIVQQGLPFYSGRVGYRFSLPVANQPVEVDLPAFAGGCVKVNSQTLFAPPYRCAAQTGADGSLEIEVMLTRRNSFGPLHRLPLLEPGYGPEHFFGEGAHWTDGYALVQNGLLEAPCWRPAAAPQPETTPGKEP